MKRLKRLFPVIALAFVMTLSTSAGQITTGVTSTPPLTTSATADGQIETPVAGDIHTPAPTSESLVETTLNLMQSMLALL